MTDRNTAKHDTPGWKGAHYTYTLGPGTTPDEINGLWRKHAGTRYEDRFYVNTEEDMDDYIESIDDDESPDERYEYEEGMGHTRVESDEADLDRLLLSFLTLHRARFKEVDRLAYLTTRSLTTSEMTMRIRDGVILAPPVPPVAVTSCDGITFRLPLDADEYARSTLERAGFVADGDGVFLLPIVEEEGKRHALKVCLEPGRADVVMHMESVTTDTSTGAESEDG